MERTDRATKLVSILLFIAMLAYIGFYILRSFSDQVQTAPAVKATIQESSQASGIIIRDELVVESGETYIEVTAEDGKMIAAGEAVAVSFNSEDALSRANRIREVELEIERISTILSGLASAEDLSTHDSAIRSAVLELSASVEQHDLKNLDSNSLRLRSLVFEGADQSVSQADVDSLEFELTGLISSSSYDTVEIPAESSGLFSAILDGYEHLSFNDVISIEPEDVKALLDDRVEVPSGAIGKLISSYTWYFVSVMDAEDAEGLYKGVTAHLDFGRYYNHAVTAEVISISQPVEGECAVVFSCDQALKETLAMRQVSAEVISSEYSGIRVPSNAIHVDEDGQTYVFVLTALQVERKNVDIIYTSDVYCLASLGWEADALRAGNEIIVSGDDIYEGKLLT